MADRNYRYVLLCRHARHLDGRLVAVRGDDDRWRFPSDAVGRALAEELGSRKPAVGYAGTPEARATAAVLLRRLRNEVIVADERPRQPALPRGDHGVWPELDPLPEGDAYERIDGELAKTDTLLLVGHQPQLSRLSARLTGRSAIPLTHSEVACLRLRKRKRRKGGWRGDLLWTLTPDDSAALAAVTDKVKGKMESAKLLSGVLTLVLTALLGALLTADRWDGLAAARAELGGFSYDGQSGVQISCVLLLSALALYLVTMYSYDSLLMPPRFWAEGTRSGRAGRWLPRRPPSSSAWVVMRNMQRIWTWLFTPANVLVAAALAVPAAPLLRLEAWNFAWVGALGVAVAAWSWWFRPVLGSED
ncbi:hypothetical protein [Actinoplanes sp. NPDC023714]|uniref:hypothetical protein n=1 Tax=Actinoplanes sp. NPDC023714 TaxID=3154322 RepID=UPI0033D85208